MTEDQGSGIAEHAEKAGVAIYLCKPHSLGQSERNEKMKILMSKRLPKETDF
ncbi:transposase protein [Pseudomonas syringae pv. tomato T1]|nr:transposase protein [Pseudomonas syringae pv. tomato T1]